MQCGYSVSCNASCSSYNTYKYICIVKYCSVCCSVLQHVLQCVLQRIAVCVAVCVEVCVAVRVAAATNYTLMCLVARSCSLPSNTRQHTATHCITPQQTATRYITLQHTATHCNTLQHTATHTATHTAIRCIMSMNTVCLTNVPFGIENTSTPAPAVCCSVLQCVAVRCSVLQCVLKCVAVCCSVCCINVSTCSSLAMTSGERLLLESTSTVWRSAEDA